SITVSVLPNRGFATDEWAGRVVGVLGINANNLTAFPYIPVANFLVSGNDSATLNLASGDPTTCVQGESLKLGDVVVMRFSPTFGEDSNGKYFEDLKNINALNLLFEPYDIADATNASPIVVTITVPEGVPFPFQDGDVVVIQDALGNAAVNGGWSITAVDD